MSNANRLDEIDAKLDELGGGISGKRSIARSETPLDQRILQWDEQLTQLKAKSLDLQPSTSDDDSSEEALETGEFEEISIDVDE